MLQLQETINQQNLYLSKFQAIIFKIQFAIESNILLNKHLSNDCL